MKTLITTVTERGQVSIPAAIRKRTQLKPGQQVTWEWLSETECRVKLAQAERPAGPLAMLGYGRKFHAPRRTAEWMNELRAGEAR